ncbi:FG-GAP repeat domain-containing protein [Streptomyces sp. NPDC056144]|uniref:FG-GAP repeat domain-containing protein n=1 Tax=unclassified Streptomyces TaxID=2593676 RepID=UPI0035E02E5C
MLRRFMGAGVAAAMLVTGGVVGAGSAFAAGDPTFGFDELDDQIIMPGTGYAELWPNGTFGSTTGRPDGTYVYAISKKPLTNAAWTTGGLPSGLKIVRNDGCAPKAGKAGVYTCDVRSSGFLGPEVEATSTAADGTTAYYGLVYVPRGSSVDAGIKEAQIAATKTETSRRAHATVTVRSKAHVAQNKMTLTTPTLPAGGTVKHTLKLHAVDKGKLWLDLNAAPGYRRWDEGELKVTVTGVSRGTATGISCDHSTGYIPDGGVYCTVTKPGDYTVTYGLKAAAGAPAWRVRAFAAYEVYNFGIGNPEKSSDFSIGSTKPVIQRHQLVGRASDGDLYAYEGTGKVSPLFQEVSPVGYSGDWNRYSAITRLGPLTVQSTGPGAVARDRSGVLWFYRTSGDGGLFTGRSRVGGGWNTYNLLAGASDLTGDKKADLLARGTDGVLRLYQGTGVTATPFKTPLRIGGGWNVYNALVGGTDLTRDGKPDLLARAKDGKTYLYVGTGSATRPFAPAKQVGTGYQGYNALVSPGDLNSDGKADLVGRDATGALYFHAGTGSATTPFATRVRVGSGWQKYNLLF